MGSKGNKISAISGAELGVLRASCIAKKPTDLQTDVWFVGSRQEADIGYVPGCASFRDRLPSCLWLFPMQISQETENAHLAGMVKRLNNLSIDQIEKKVRDADADEDGDAPITVAKVAKAAAVLADAVAAAVARPVPTAVPTRSPRIKRTTSGCAPSSTPRAGGRPRWRSSAACRNRESPRRRER
ncbi:unnamed protein product [Ectocarpus sp. 12 AP-2014]